MTDPVTDPQLLALLNGGDDGPKPVTDPAILAQLNGETPKGGPGKTGKSQKATLQQVDDTVRALANGATFGLADRFSALMSPGDYGANLKNEQAKSSEFHQENPVAATGANLVGGAAVPLGFIGKIPQGLSLGARTLYGMLGGGAIGGLQGAGNSPDWTDLKQTGKDAAIGTGTGAIIGGALPATSAVIGKGYNAVANALRGGADDMSRPASKILVDALKADGPAAVQAKVSALGPDAMLADAGPAMLGKTQGASLNSDEGRSVLANALTTRNEGTNARITGDVNKALGPAEDPQTVTNAIRARRSEVDNAAYPTALGKAPPVQTGALLEQIDGMIPRAVGMERKALENLRGMLVVKEGKAAAETAGGKPIDRHAQDVADIRAKYGDSAAEAFDRQASGKPSNEPGPQSLNEFLATHGLGHDPELEAIGAHAHTVNVEGVGRRKLVKQGGWPLDYAREAAEEAGYLQGDINKTSTIRDLLDAIDAEMRGQKRFPMGYEGTVSKREAVAMSEREQHEWEQHLLDHPEAAPNVPQAAAKPPKLQDNAEVLHKIKGELDNVIEYDQPGLGVPAGALTRQQGALKMMRGQLNDTLENQVPGYREANRASAALARRADAVEAGTQYLGSGKTTPSPDRFAAEFDPLSQGEKIAFAKGSRGNIDRVLGTKANDLQALRGELQGEGGWNAAKLAIVHGQDAAADLTNSVDRNLKFRDTYNKVVENSQTAQRTAAQKAMKPDPSSEIPLINPNTTVSGFFGTLGKKAVSKTVDALLKRDPTAAYGEVARILSAQGAERDSRLLALTEALNRRQANAATASKFGDRAALVAALLEQGGARHMLAPQDTSDRK